MNDFLNTAHSIACVCPLEPCALHTAKPFTGYRCDTPGCAAEIRGATETRQQLHALTARAEAAGWQCVLVDGTAMHFCPDHVDESRPPRVRYDEYGRVVRKP